MSTKTTEVNQIIKMKDFPDRTSYMREYQYINNANKVAYRRGRYNKNKKEPIDDKNLL